LQETTVLRSGLLFLTHAGMPLECKVLLLTKRWLPKVSAPFEVSADTLPVRSWIWITWRLAVFSRWLLLPLPGMAEACP